MKEKLLFLFLFVGVFTFSQNLSSPQQFYADVLDFVVKQHNVNSIGDGLEQAEFDNRKTAISDDGKYLTIEYDLPDEAKLLIIKKRSDGLTSKIMLIHKISLSYFIMDYLTDIAVTYKPYKIWYNKDQAIILTYEMKENTVGVLEVIDVQ